jgi:hypothetical protein
MPNNCWAKHLGRQVAKATLWTQGDTANHGKDWPKVPFPWRPSTTRAFRHRHAAFLPALTPVQATASPHSSSPRQTLQRAKGNHAHTALRSTYCTGTTRQSSETGDHLRPWQVPTIQSDRSQPSTADDQQTHAGMEEALQHCSEATPLRQHSQPALPHPCETKAAQHTDSHSRHCRIMTTDKHQGA